MDEESSASNRRYMGSIAAETGMAQGGLMGGGAAMRGQQPAVLGGAGGPVASLTEGCAKSVHELHEMLSLLENKLSPILQAQPPTAGEKSAPDSPGASNLSQVLYEIHIQISSATHRVRAFIDRCEI